MVMGSPGFTAPERIRGEDATPASDLWSLGATLYAAVEGHGPFERRGGAITTMSAIINEEAPVAPTAGALGPVIAALLRREPADRPDAATATRMISEVLPQLPTRPPGAPAGTSRPPCPSRRRQAPGPSGPAPQPGETALDFASAGQAMTQEPPAELPDRRPASGSAAQTPNTREPAGDPSAYEPRAPGLRRARVRRRPGRTQAVPGG